MLELITSVKSPVSALRTFRVISPHFLPVFGCSDVTLFHASCTLTSRFKDSKEKNLVSTDVNIKVDIRGKIWTYLSMVGSDFCPR